MRFWRHFGEIVGFGESFDEFFGFSTGEADEGDGVGPVVMGDGVVDFVFFGKAADLVSLLFRGGFDCCVHLFLYWFMNIEPIG